MLQVAQVLVSNDKGIASLAVDGYDSRLDIQVGSVAAMSMLYASGVELRRPSTVHTWFKTLKVIGYNSYGLGNVIIVIFTGGIGVQGCLMLACWIVQYAHGGPDSKYS